MRDLFQCRCPPLLDGCREEHDRESQACEWNRTGDEWSHCLHFSFSPSPGMNCFIMIKDKTGINDTFTFPHQRGTCLNLSEGACGSCVCVCLCMCVCVCVCVCVCLCVFSLLSCRIKRAGSEADKVATCNVCLFSFIMDSIRAPCHVVDLFFCTPHATLWCAVCVLYKIVIQSTPLAVEEMKTFLYLVYGLSG